MKKLLQIFVLALGLSSAVSAQSISFTTDPLTTAQVGATVTVNYQYTSANPCQIYCAIELLNGWTFAGTVADQFLGSVVAGNNTAGVINLTIPANTLPTANLQTGQNYKIKIELKTEAGVFLAGQFPGTEINITPATVTPTISFTGTPLTTAQIGTNVSVGYQYSLAAPGQIYCSIEKRDNLNAWAGTIIESFLDPVVAGSNVAGNLNLLIPNSAVPTASLTNGENYKIKIELRNSAGGYLAGVFPSSTINFTPNLNTVSFDNTNVSVYPNPTKDFLTIDGIENMYVNQFSVVDMIGKKVLSSTQLISDKIDVSSITPGIYFLLLNTDNSQKQIKFIKK